MNAKSLMVLGTGSGVGKSVIAAGFCRWLADQGLRVAPFKAQNMSNNAYVTEEGGEIGRAQAVQAECARVTPHTDMNPVLLKPAADNRSQVIIQGHPAGHFSARDYYGQKDRLLKAVRESYERLAARFDIIVIEGAGSPAEVNLKQSDFVNMRMAEMADARCVLAGDIDRGGIFASLLGTMDLLEPHERQRIIGLIVNKFRGDLSLFEDGVAFLEARSGKKVWGVLPYDRTLWIEEEDSLAAAGSALPPQTAGRRLDIAVILLPRISNFTDFEVLKHESGVELRYLKNPGEWGSPDLVILPGTKATLGDLRYLKTSGFYDRLRSYAENGGRVLGICGGYQMMGREIRDADGEESAPAAAGGLGFLNMTTEFFPEKVLKRVEETFRGKLFGTFVRARLEAYEIHMGRTVCHEPYPRFGAGGAVHPSGRWMGTYYHGLFDGDNFRKTFLRALAASAGKTLSDSGFELRAFKEQQYDYLAGLLERHLDLQKVLSWARPAVPEPTGTL